MRRRSRAACLIPAIACAALLAGCSAGPDREAVVERFAIELAAGAGEATDWQDMAAGLADDAFAGNCGSDAYRAGLGEDPLLLYAWAATCLMYFEADMTDAQAERARLDVVEFAISGS